MKIYVLTGSWVDYDDSNHWNVAAYVSQEVADRMAKQAQAELKAWVREDNKLTKAFDRLPLNKRDYPGRDAAREALRTRMLVVDPGVYLPNSTYQVEELEFHNGID